MTSAPVRDPPPGLRSRAWLAQLPPKDLYGALLFQVTGQQVSVPATRRTLARIQALFGGRLPFLRRLRIGRGTTGRPTRERFTMSGGCTHLDRICDVAPSLWGCEDRLAQRRRDWVHLRVCQECGHVGCCDNSR